MISHAVWLYDRFNISHRDIEDLLAERGMPRQQEIDLPMARSGSGRNFMGTSGKVHSVNGVRRLLERPYAVPVIRRS